MSDFKASDLVTCSENLKAQGGFLWQNDELNLSQSALKVFSGILKICKQTKLDLESLTYDAKHLDINLRVRNFYIWRYSF